MHIDSCNYNMVFGKDTKIHTREKSALGRFIFAVMNHYDQNNFERKKFILLILLNHCSSLKEIRTGALTKQEHGSRP